MTIDSFFALSTPPPNKKWHKESLKREIQIDKDRERDKYREKETGIESILKNREKERHTDD